MQQAIKPQKNLVDNRSLLVWVSNKWGLKWSGCNDEYLNSNATTFITHINILMRRMSPKFDFQQKQHYRPKTSFEDKR